mgnify:CR=1 FL=1
MIQATVTISNKLGLHARASAKLTKLAGSFACEIWMSKGDRRVNAKSLLGILSLGITKDTEILLIANGADEQEAIEGLVALIQSNFVVE